MWKYPQRSKKEKCIVGMLITEAIPDGPGDELD